MVPERNEVVFTIYKLQVVTFSIRFIPKSSIYPRLYTSLSLIQLDRRKEAKQIILSQYPTVKRYRNHRYLASLYSATVFKYNATSDSLKTLK